jgi:N-glycosylase/DNA lyase
LREKDLCAKLSRLDSFVEELEPKIRALQTSSVQNKINQLMDYFLYLREKGTPQEIMSELAFCILAANFSASKSLEIQQEIHTNILKISKEEIIEILRRKGHRYPDTRATYIINAREKISYIFSLIRSQQKTQAIRDWLVNNVNGVGMKVASHFLRNTGRFDVAILDFHILDLLDRNGVINRPKTLTRKKYLEIENILFYISQKIGIPPGILDLYLWYLETGNIVK